MTRTKIARNALLGAVGALAAGTFAIGPASAQPIYPGDSSYAADNPASVDNSDAVDADITVDAPAIYHTDRDPVTNEETMVTQEHVDYSDLDLTNAMDRDALQERVVYAANAACQRLSDAASDSFDDWASSDDCQASAMDSASGQVRDAIYEANS